MDSSLNGGTLHGSGAPDEEARAHLGSGSPTMPHLQLYGKNLDDAYPPIGVPEDEELPDLAQDMHDLLLQRGLEEAAVISREARDHGRKRRMSPTASTSGAKETVKDSVNLVEEKTGEEAASRSTLGRRRSERKSPPPAEGSQGGPVRSPWEDPRIEEHKGEGSGDYEDHVDECRNDQDHHADYVDAIRNDWDPHMSELESPLSFVSVFDLCSCDLHRLDRALLPGGVHLAYTGTFLK